MKELFSFLNRFGLFPNRFFLLLTFFFICFSKVTNGKVFINLNIEDCANCSLVLKKIISIKTIDSLNIVLPSKFAKNHFEVLDRYGLVGVKEIRFIYSDSLALILTELNQFQFGSNIFVFNTKNSLIFKSLLKGVDLNALSFYSIFSKSWAMRIKEFENLNISSIDYFGGLLTLQDYFNNIYIYDLKNGKQSKLLLSDNLIQEMYKIYFGKDFDIRYPVMQRVFKYSGNMKPEIQSFSITRNSKQNEIFILYTIRDFQLDNNRDTIITMNQIIYNYSFELNKGQFYSKSLSQNVLNGQDVGGLQLFHYNDQIYMHFYNNSIGENDSTTFIASLSFEIKGPQAHFSVNNIISEITPKGYFKRVGKVYNHASTVSKNGILYYFSDSLYVIDRKIKIPIPFQDKREKNNFKSISSYKHIYNSSDSTFCLFYLRKEFQKWGAKPHLMQFKNTGELIFDKSIENFIDQFAFETTSFIHPFQIVGIDGKTGEIQFVDL